MNRLKAFIPLVPVEQIVGCLACHLNVRMVTTSLDGRFWHIQLSTITLDVFTDYEDLPPYCGQKWLLLEINNHSISHTILKLICEKFGGQVVKAVKIDEYLFNKSPEIANVIRKVVDEGCQHNGDFSKCDNCTQSCTHEASNISLQKQLSGTGVEILKRN